MVDEIEKVHRFSGGRWFGCQVAAYGYFAQLWIGRLHFHCFLGPDKAEAMHDHPWEFSTFPLVSYVEDTLDHATGKVTRQVVRRFRWQSRPATHTHRFLGPWSGEYDADGLPTVRLPGKVFTIAWVQPKSREWSFVRVKHDGTVKRFPWLPYLKKIEKKPRLRPYEG